VKRDKQFMYSKKCASSCLKCLNLTVPDSHVEQVDSPRALYSPAAQLAGVT